MLADHRDVFHPLAVDPGTGLAELAGCLYLASQSLQAKDGRSVIYLTEAATPEHLYKFIGPVQQGGALQHGTLYVAALGDEGHGRWLPLVFARHGLSVRDGYRSAQDILADAADAARRAGATRIPGMFAPRARGYGGFLLLCDHANPALVWREAMGDVASLSFAWQGSFERVLSDTKVHFPLAGRSAEPLRS